MRRWIGLIAVAGAAWAQENSAAFEAVSVKPWVDGTMLTWCGCQGGPGSNDPGRIECRYVTLRLLLSRAFGVRNQEAVGPGWIDDVRFNIDARLPTGAKKEQVAEMYRRMLAERFHAEMHSEKRLVPGYALTLGKGGIKLHEAAPETPADDAPRPPGPLPKGPDGFVQLRPSSFAGGAVVLYNSGHAKLQASGITMAQLADSVGGQLDKIVADETELSGKYDVTLYWAPQADQPGASRRESGGGGVGVEASGPEADMYSALEQQAGLKLVAKKIERRVAVLDRAEKVPVEN